MTFQNHPHVLCAASIIREGGESDAPFSIRSIALFTAIREGENELCFDLQHVGFNRGMPNGEILEGLCLNVPPGAALVLRNSPPQPHALQATLAAGNLPPPDNVKLCERRLIDASVIALECSDANLDWIGAALGLQMARAEADITERSRRAPQAAQALWASFVAVACSPADARAYAAAFQAWDALERARPLPF